MLRLTRPNDARIVQTVLAGNLDSFGALVERYLGSVHALALARC